MRICRIPWWFCDSLLFGQYLFQLLVCVRKRGFGDGSWRFDVHKPNNLVDLWEMVLTGKGIRGNTTRLVRNNSKIGEMASSVILVG